MKKMILFLLVLLMTAATGAWAQTEYTVTVVKGSASHTSAAPGTPVNITANGPASGQVFDKWQAIGVTLNNENAMETTFTMPSNDVHLTATYKKVPITYTVSLNDGAENPTTWTAKIGTDATTQFGALPLKGVTEGQTVTLQYSGDRHVKSITATEINPKYSVPLTMEAITAGTIIVSKPIEGMQCSLNGGTKTEMSGDKYTIDVVAGDKVAFYGHGTDIKTYHISTTTITQITGGTATVKVYGNIMSLVDEDNYVFATTLTEEYTFSYLFQQNDVLTDASDLLLPATTLSNACYQGMFYGCDVLTTVPELKAENLASYCYYHMFEGCKSLTTAPELRVETLVKNCYQEMFKGCSKLASVTCKATSGFDAYWCLKDWLSNAGTDNSVTERIIHVKSAAGTDADKWYLTYSGTNGKRWTAVADAE